VNALTRGVYFSHSQQLVYKTLHKLNHAVVKQCGSG
jgi:hypothetical protein